MPYDYTLTAIIPASPQEIYRAWLDSAAHSEMTGAEARMSDEIGGEVSAWDGYITGRNLELVPHERIVQSWRTTEFTDDHGDSIIAVILEEDDEGTLLTLVHSNVPEGLTSYEESGWQEHYFEPMAVFFSGREGSRKRVAAAPKPKRSRATAKSKSKLKSKSKSKSKTKMNRIGPKVVKKAAKQNSKRTALKVTKKAVRKSSKRAVAKSKKKVR
ncbi:MAG: SRPBCC domain-containing protein [Xanthobacteraceae bacterium]